MGALNPGPKSGRSGLVEYGHLENVQIGRRGSKASSGYAEAHLLDNQFAFPTLDTYIWSFVFSKMAFAIYFMRIFPQRIHKQVNRGLLVFLLMQGIAETVVSQVMCVPRAKMFLPNSPGECLDTIKFYYASVSNPRKYRQTPGKILANKPIATLYGIRMARPKKLAVFLLSSLGLGVCVASIIRVQLIPRTRSSDPTYDLVDAMLWSEVEVSALIICVCVPEIYILVQRTWPVTLVRRATSRPAAGDAERNERRRESLGAQLRRAFKRANIKTGQGSWYGSRSGASSGTWRRSRFGVTSSVSAGRQSRHRLSTDDTGQSSVQSPVDEEPSPQSDSPDHGGILVTHEIEVGIETDEDSISEADVSDAAMTAPEYERDLTESSIVDQDGRLTDTTNDSNAGDGEQPPLEGSE
ncbi:hypothetical protein MCOR21_009125 [Pyricularia oryzae]|nr:hypothetical protein MCOR21_009125 [Pyricularia oryzae]KAI6546989.1 hypothetical protein MCOR05_000271 [Pyricularia oryzae]